MSAEIAAGVRRQPAVIEESLATKILRGLAKTPIHLLLIFLGLIWLVPTFGLFITAIAKPEAIGTGAWWKVISHPSAFTWANYSHMFHTHSITPVQMALIPIYRLYNDTNLYDTLFGLILFHTAFALPFAIFLLRNFFIGIPRDLMEAARIDGASEIYIFLRIILPLGIPALASLTIFAAFQRYFVQGLLAGSVK